MSSPPPPSKEKDKDIIGTLVVVVLKARNLKDKHTFSKQDPYATVKLGRASKSTKVEVRGGQHPVWDEDLHLPVHVNASKSNRTLTVQCYAKESREDDLLGEGTVDIEETLKTYEFDDWVKLEQDGSYQGEIYLEMTYFPVNAPRPAAKPQQKESPKPSVSQPTSSAGSSPKAKVNLLPPPSLQPGGLYRRPSKLPPQERLWRPPQAQSYKTSPLGSPGISPQRSDGPGSSRHTTPSPHRRDDVLPPLPPLGLGVPDANEGRASKLMPVPSILRPGNAKSSPVPIPVASNRRYSLGAEQPQAYVPGTYIAPASPPQMPGSYNGHASPPPIRIPEPMLGPSTQSQGGYGHGYGYGGGGYQEASGLPDPYARTAQQNYNYTRPSPSPGPVYTQGSPPRNATLPPRDYGQYSAPPPGPQSTQYQSYTPNYPPNYPSSSNPQYSPNTQPRPQHRHESSYTPSPAPAPAPAPAPKLYSSPQPSASSYARSHQSQEDADAAFAAQLAREEGIDVERLKAQEADEEFARRLAREINSDVVATRDGETRGTGR